MNWRNRTRNLIRFLKSWTISVLILSTFVLNLGTAYAHDPDSPEWIPPIQYPVTWGEGVEENLNGVTVDEWFMVVGLTVSVCLMIALPKLFDGENVNYFHKTFTFIDICKQNEKREICVRLNFPIG